MPTPRETHLLIRGPYDRPGEVVTPALPAFLPPLARRLRAQPPRASPGGWSTRRTR